MSDAPIYHFSAKVFTRSNGAPAVAKAAYRSGERLHDNELDRTFDYSSRELIIHSEIVLPENCPEQYRDRETLWNAVEEQKTRSNSRYAREFEIATPNEWSDEETINYMREFIKNEFTDKGMIADWSFHKTKNDNNHIHCMCTTDPVNEQGEFIGAEKKVFANAAEIECDQSLQNKLEINGVQFEAKDENTIIVSAADINSGKLEEYGIEIERKDIKATYNDNFPSFDKDRKEETEQYRLKEYNDDGTLKQRHSIRNGKDYTTQQYKQVKTERNPWDSKEQLKEWRQHWAEHANRYLAPEHHIDHRTLKEQGIDRVPQVHEGVQAKEIEQRGDISDNREINRSIKQYNSLWDKVKSQVQTLKYEIVSKIASIREELVERYDQFKRSQEQNESRDETHEREYRREPEVSRDIEQSERNERTDISERIAAGSRGLDRPGDNIDRNDQVARSDNNRVADIIARANRSLGKSENVAEESEVQINDRTNELITRAKAAIDGAGRSVDGEGRSVEGETEYSERTKRNLEAGKRAVERTKRNLEAGKQASERLSGTVKRSGYDVDRSGDDSGTDDPEREGIKREGERHHEFGGLSL